MASMAIECSPVLLPLLRCIDCCVGAARRAALKTDVGYGMDSVEGHAREKIRSQRRRWLTH